MAERYLVGMSQLKVEQPPGVHIESGMVVCGTIRFSRSMIMMMRDVVMVR